MNRLDAEFSAILTNVVGASVKPQLWDEVCDQIVAYSGGVNCNIFEYNPVTERCVSLHGSENLKLVAPDLRLRLSDGSATEDKHLYDALRQAEPLKFRTEASLVGAKSTQAIPSNPFRDSILERTGAVSRNAGRLNDVGPHVDGLELHLKQADDLPDELICTIDVLMGVIAKSIETGRVMRKLTHGYGALLDAFELFDFAAVICEADGSLVVSNARFREMARDGDAFVERDSTIFPRHSSDHPMLAQMIAHSHRATASHNMFATIRRRSGKLPLVAKAAPVQNGDLYGAKLTLLILLDPEDDTRINADGLEAFGLLSPAELAVCAMLIRGYQTFDISTVRDTSIATVRSQIKSVSAKLACTSRLDLLRLAMATSMPMQDK